jgi:hypothetical protein
MAISRLELIGWCPLFTIANTIEFMLVTSSQSYTPAFFTYKKWSLCEATLSSYIYRLPCCAIFMLFAYVSYPALPLSCSSIILLFAYPAVRLPYLCDYFIFT